MVASTLGGIEFELQKALRSGEAATSSATFAAFLDTLQGGEDVNGDVELAFRRALDNCMEEDGVLAAECAAIMEDSSVMRLIQFSLTLCEQNPSHQCTTLPKVPFILLEDLLEALSVRSAEALWSFVESLAERSTAEPFSKGKLVILRTCNSMLRKLSKVVHSRFSGRILMFMAALCPISDRSAVNLTGKFNTGKSIIFDDEETFKRDFDGPLEITLPSPLHSPKKDDGGKKQQGEAAPATQERSSYEVYKQFWQLQSRLCADRSSVDSEAKWAEAMVHFGAVIDTFERNPYSDLELARAQQQREAVSQSSGAPGSSAAPYGGYIGTKFITSAKLFSLQARDTELRQQIAAQMLFFCRYYREKPPAWAVLDSKPAPTKEATKEERGGRLDKLRESREESAAAAAAAGQARVKSDVSHLEARVVALLTHSPNGNDLLAVLRTTMLREGAWIAWKSHGCPAFERPPVPLPEQPSSSSSSSSSKEVSGAPTHDYYFDTGPAHVAAAMKRVCEGVPSYEELIESYVDADDPANGIEEAYHPKLDHVYCWRALRLMAQSHFCAFETMQDGDISKGLRAIRGDAAEVVVKAEATVDAAMEATVDAAMEVTVDAAMEAAGEVAVKAEATVDAAMEATVDAAMQATVDAAMEAAGEVAVKAEATVDAAMEVTVDAAMEAAGEVAVEAAVGAEGGPAKRRRV